MRLIVHAGPGKTGTTAIQKSLLKSSQALRQHGILYLGLMLERAPVQRHSWQKPGGFELLHRMPAERARSELLALFREVMAEAAGAGLHTLVLSNESLLRRPRAMLQVLPELVADGHDVAAIAYARRYDALARSSYIQWGLVHKTYAGPLKPFAEWMQGRQMALGPSLAQWHGALGPRFLLRNFDACDDVVGDFVDAVGLPPGAVAPMRTYETPSANEIALRALFNETEAGKASPSRFSRLFNAGAVAFDRPLGKWLAALMPDAGGMAAHVAALDPDLDKVNDMLRAQGQPELVRGAAAPAPELDTDALVGALFRIVSAQALRVEALEQAVSTLAGQAQAAPAAADEAEPPPAKDAAATFAPALGFFGACEQDHLRVSFPAMRLKRLRLSIAEDKPTFLNLRGMQLRLEGRPLEPDPAWEQTQSSVSGGVGNGPAGLLARRGIHSAAEAGPWWQVDFAEPVILDELRIWNRSDGWGSRSRTLVVEATDDQGRLHRLHDAQSAQAFRRVLDAAAQAAGQPPGQPFPGTPDAAAELRSGMLRAIAKRLLSGALPLERADWRAIVQLLPAWGATAPTDDEWTILAAFLLAQHRAKGPTSIKAFSLLLDRQSRLRRLQDELNRLAAARGFGTLMLTRHGIKAEGILRQHPERFLEHLQGVVGALHDAGLAPVIAYGTLLGAVREGNFIAHDDDIDLLFRSGARDRAEAEAEQPRIVEFLRDRGYKVVSLLPDSLNIHVINRDNGAVMDVFPCWEEGGRLHMHMESMKVRGIAPGIVYPARELQMLGRTLPAPRDPDAFLEERYGPGWRVSDQFFEWPWPLLAEDGQ